MLIFKKISTNEHMYNWAMNVLAESFPESERRDDISQREVMKRADYFLCAIVHDGQPVGVIGYFDTPKFVYFENFCIEPALRNRGFGSQTLRQLTENLQKPFILEAELPTDELTRRRINFYKRNGMVKNVYKHIQPHYHKGDADLPLLVLTYKEPITAQQYADFRKYLDDNVDVK